MPIIKNLYSFYCDNNYLKLSAVWKKYLRTKISAKLSKIYAIRIFLLSISYLQSLKYFLTWCCTERVTCRYVTISIFVDKNNLTITKDHIDAKYTNHKKCLFCFYISEKKRGNLNFNLVTSLGYCS